MKKLPFIALLVVGIILTVWGYNLSNSFNSEVTELVTGAPSDKAMWLLTGGIAAAVIGLLGTVLIKK